MKSTAKILSLAGLLVLSASAWAQTPNPNPQPARPNLPWMAGYIDPGQPQPPYAPADTPLGTGPHPAIMATEPAAEEFVAYYPADLSRPGGKKLPVVVWGNGSCAYMGNMFRHFLTDIASHDYFILAGGPMGAPDGGASETITIESNPAVVNPDRPLTGLRRGAPPPPPPDAPKMVTTDLLSRGIDWAIAENNRQGSKFFHRLDTSNIAVMGQSCGGGLAAKFGLDKRVKTIGLWSAGIGPHADLSATMTKPVLIVTGDPRYDVAFYAGLSGFESLQKPPVFRAWRVNMTHLGTYRQSDGGELSPIATAWLDWRLKGDQHAAGMFKGQNCGLCTNRHWHVQKRHID